MLDFLSCQMFWILDQIQSQSLSFDFKQWFPSYDRSNLNNKSVQEQRLKSLRRIYLLQQALLRSRVVQVHRGAGQHFQSHHMLFFHFGDIQLKLMFNYIMTSIINIFSCSNNIYFLRYTFIQLFSISLLTFIDVLCIQTENPWKRIRNQSQLEKAF